MSLAYEPIKPVVAAWSLEYPQAYGVIFFQRDGNEHRVIGSRLWEDFPPLHACIADVKQAFPWKHCEFHVIPHDPDSVWSDLFLEAGFLPEPVPDRTDRSMKAIARELFPVLSIDTAPREWAEKGNNFDLIESLQTYHATEVNDTYSEHHEHTKAVYLTRAFEIYALWRHLGGSDSWGRPLDYSQYLRTVI